MSEYVILVGLSTYENPEAQTDRHKRLSAIYDLVFSLGPAWHGNQASILLKSGLSREQIVERLSQLVRESDLVSVVEVSVEGITTIGYAADEEGLDALHPDVVKFGVSPSGGTYPMS